MFISTLNQVRSLLNLRINGLNLLCAPAHSTVMNIKKQHVLYMCLRACAEVIAHVSHPGSQDVVPCMLIDDLTSQYALRYDEF
jgi:hypothetical protein